MLLTLLMGVSRVRKMKVISEATLLINCLEALLTITVAKTMEV
jgi:hypothetical protein